MSRFLFVSLVLNGVLLGFAFWRAAPQPIPPRPTRGAASESAAPRGANRHPRVTSFANAPATPWAAIESADPRQLIANLRALGCPEDTVRDLIVSRVCRRYRDQLLAEEAERIRAQDIVRGRSQREWRESTQANARARAAMQSELESLLGQPWARLAASITGLRWLDSEGEYLPLDQRRRLRDLEQRYVEQRQTIEWDRTMLGLDREARAQADQLRQQHEAEVAAVLTPEEFENWKYRESAASRFVRNSLPGTKSEAEFRRLVDLAREFDLTDPPISRDVRSGGGAPDDDPAARDDARRRAAFDERLKEVLGEDRLAEQRAEEQARLERERQVEIQRNEQEARAMAEGVAAEVGIPAADVGRFMARIFEEQGSLSKRLEELEKTLTGTPEERQRQMQAAVEAELEQMAVETMGEKGRDFVDKLKEREGKP